MKKSMNSQSGAIFLLNFYVPGGEQASLYQNQDIFSGAGCMYFFRMIHLSRCVLLSTREPAFHGSTLFLLKMTISCAVGAQ